MFGGRKCERRTCAHNIPRIVRVVSFAPYDTSTRIRRRHVKRARRVAAPDFEKSRALWRSGEVVESVSEANEPARDGDQIQIRSGRRHVRPVHVADRVRAAGGHLFRSNYDTFMARTGLPDRILTVESPPTWRRFHVRFVYKYIRPSADFSTSVRLTTKIMLCWQARRF